MAKTPTVSDKTQRLTYQTQAPPDEREADDRGQVSDGWADAGRYWCSLTALSGAALVNAQQIHKDVTHRIGSHHFARPDPGLARWTLGTRVFSIISALDPDNRRRELIFLCVEASTPPG